MLLQYPLSEAKHRQWLELEGHVRIVDACRAEAAALSQAIYEADPQARSEAERRRWECSFVGLTEPRQLDLAVVDHGGAPLSSTSTPVS